MPSRIPSVIRIANNASSATSRADSGPEPRSTTPNPPRPNTKPPTRNNTAPESTVRWNRSDMATAATRSSEKTRSAVI